jgi:hypothetical protein
MGDIMARSAISLTVDIASIATARSLKVLSPMKIGNYLSGRRSRKLPWKKVARGVYRWEGKRLPLIMMISRRKKRKIGR